MQGKKAAPGEVSNRKGEGKSTLEKARLTGWAQVPGGGERREAGGQ